MYDMELFIVKVTLVIKLKIIKANVIITRTFFDLYDISVTEDTK